MLFAALSKTSEQALKSLASEEDVADVIALYNDFFNGPSSLDSVSLTNQLPSIGFQFSNKGLGGGDPGVQAEAMLRPEALAHNLGFANGLPLLFNTHRHCGGLNLWDAHNPGEFESGSSSLLEPMSLHWHQLVGVHATIRMSISKEVSSGGCSGVLVADEVGLGKTFQAATTITFISDLIARQNGNHPLPPIMRKQSSSSILHCVELMQFYFVVGGYFGGLATVPSQPFLIIAPGTLLSQWLAELKVVLKPKTFDLLVYPTSKVEHEAFWSPTGLFHSSKHPLSNRIIIASHSVRRWPCFYSCYFAYHLANLNY